MMCRYQMNKMKERGTTKQILDKYEAEKQVCPDYSGKPLGFGQCFTAFIMLIGGVFLGLMALRYKQYITINYF